MSVEIIGKQIASLRKEKGVKQEELAKYVGVSTQAVSKWENGGVPDVELIPKIADFFSVSIDNLFNRNIPNDNLQSVLMKKIAEAPYDRKFKIAFNFCWDIERALMRHPEYIDKGSIENYEKEIGCSDQHYSSIIRNDGFTRMGIANRSQYFLIVPNPRSTNDAYFKGINYPSFFNAYRVDTAKVSLFNPLHWYVCNKCKRLTCHNVAGVCPAYHCDGELVEIKPEKEFFDNHYYRLFRELEIRDLRKDSVMMIETLITARRSCFRRCHEKK